jgi:hypothetical protein
METILLKNVRSGQCNFPRLQTCHIHTATLLSQCYSVDMTGLEHVVGPCHHSMVRPHVVDTGTVSEKEGSR